MRILQAIRKRFEQALECLVDNPVEHAARIAPARDPRFGDYQANIAMPLAKTLGKKPMEIAQLIVDRLTIDDLCSSTEIAAPGFINLRLRSDYLASSLWVVVNDDRTGIERAGDPKNFVIDFSAPNVAKPMHVGHIRSTVIGDSLTRILRFLGHQVVTDNHLGDWGTQFGMVIYGYKHFVDSAAFAANPVSELSRMYRLVQQVIGYQNAVQQLPARQTVLQRASEQLLVAQAAVRSADKQTAKDLKAAERAVSEASESVAGLKLKIADVERDSNLAAIASDHPDLDQRAQNETAKLHSGDALNLALWHQFLPLCIEEIERIYKRLGIAFDYQLGESFYQPMLASLVERLIQSGTAQESEGAICIFLTDFDAPMLIRKQDGAFLYATTDLATIEYRAREFSPDTILYVVDHRQSEHFSKLFIAAKAIGYEHIELKHVSFGTVLGPDGKPFKTRSGSVVGLDYLLDEAVDRAYQLVCDPERLQKANLQMTKAEQLQVAQSVGLGAIKYADLCHNRTSDYEFNIDQMVQLDGNTSAYIQYSYARASSILRNAEFAAATTVLNESSIELQQPAERDLALLLLQFEDTLHQCLEDYLPSVLAAYLYSLAKQYSIFFDQCPVLRAENAQLKHSRLQLCQATCQTLSRGLELLGIATVPRM